MIFSHLFILYINKKRKLINMNSEKYNINSFSDNATNLIKSVNNSISTLNGIADTFTTNKDMVNIPLMEDNIQLPSYTNLINRLKNVENTIAALTSGNGAIKLLDGTHRKVEVSTMPNVPKKIKNIVSPTTFKSNSNWFFENLIFPKINVSIDLTNQIEDDSDRVKICRVIIPKTDDNVDFYTNYIRDNKLTYNELVDLLTGKNINYYEDVDTINFPLTVEKYSGDFVINKTEIIDGKLYYYIDNVYYGINKENDENVSYNINLKVNDTLRFNNTLYIIEEIDLTLNRVKMISQVGLDSPSIGDTMSIYVSPFASKIIEVGIGYDEINCIYFKGVNEKYNLVSNDWSEPVNFITNELTNENNETLTYFYNTYVSDFGAEWISQAKEKKIPAFKGLTPNTPILNESNFKVVQINTQVNSTLHQDEIINMSSQIMSLKYAINSSRETITKIKKDLSNTTVQAERYNLQNILSSEENTLSSNTSEYKSLVNYLNSYVRENSINVANPKYRVRGFFPIPEPKYIYEKNENGENIKVGKQDVIGFDILYRYIKNDETGVELGTYSYVDGSTSMNGIFSDWNIAKSKIREKIFNNELGIFVWSDENTGDGNEININQIDIPINDGEKVEIKVRSISEAGYPTCPIKSEWSKSVIISFPSNLSTNNQFKNIWEDAKSDATAIQLDDIMKSAGYYNHIEDERLSSDNTLNYHHNADRIYFYKNTTDASGNTNTETKSVSEMIKSLEGSINLLNTKIYNIASNLADLQATVKQLINEQLIDKNNS